jgi:hypothetical protein
VKRIIWLLLALSLIFSLSVCGKQQTRAKPLVAYERPEDAQDVVLENEFLELRFLSQTAQIILKDKIRGTEWHSTPPGAASDTLSNVITMDMALSQFSLQYANVSGVGETLYSSSSSIEKGMFEYELIDGGLEVNYTVGNVARTFIIPTAAPEKRLLTFLNNMESDVRRRVEANYRLYDINNLRANDDRAALLERFPDLAQEKVYVLRDNTQEFMREQLEELFEEAGYSRDDYFEDASRYPAAAGPERPAFTITLRYHLDGKSMIISVPFDRIAYHPSYPIIRLDLLPFFGAGGMNDDGYLFVPDGSGALIYFNNGKYNQIASNNPVYGWDEAMPRDVVVSDNRAAFPVYGVQKNGNAIVCIIEEGASYANVQADVSGRNSSYNRVYPYFDMVHGSLMDISGRSDRSVYLYESGLPEGENIKVRYTICENDGYVGMAKEYRSWLLKKYPQLGRKSAITGVPVAVEIIGAVNKTQHRLGIPFDLPLKLTTYKDAENMVQDFAKFGWKNVKVKFTGWFNRSYEHRVPSDIKLINELGNKKSFEGFVSTAQQNGFDLFPEAEFMFMRDLKPGDGFNLYRDASRYVSRKRVEKYPFSFVWFGERIRWGKLSYLARPVVSMNLIDTFMKKSEPLGIKNIAFRSMGSRLGGDYNEKRRVSREAAIKMRQEKFEQLSNAGSKVMVSAGYEYSVPWADFIIDMAIDYQGFSITDVAVPFYQIALSGLVPYTGRAINLAEDYTKNLLKTIEGGAGLYFSFMAEETVELQETKFRQFYANEYGKWVGDADALYKRFSADFAGLYGQAIDNHIILAPDVTVTVYANGTRVVVNRSDNAFDYNGRMLRADSYIVLKQGE